MKKTLLIMLSVMGVAGWTSVQAQLISVNFIDDSINVMWGGGNAPAPAAMSGAAVLGAAGDVWNGLGGFNYSAYPLGASAGPLALVDSTGAATPVTLSLTAANGTYDANSVNWNNYSPFSWASLANEQGTIGYPNTPWAVLMASMLVSHATAMDTVTLNGLPANTAYELVVYSAGDLNLGAAGTRTSTFMVNGNTQTSTWNANTSTLINGVDYLVFNAMSDGAGTLVINYGNSATGDESDFNGLQLLQVIPEPSTFALLGAGMALLLGVQRRRNS